MKNKEIEIDFSPGHHLEKAYEELQSESKRLEAEVYGLFNGHKITSNMTLDDIYLEVMGRTEKEHKQNMLNFFDRIKKEEEEHKQRIPELKKEYIERAKSILKEDKLDYWNSILDIRLSDLYRGMELNSTLQLTKHLDIEKGSLEKAEEMFLEEGHSGMSASLVFAMMKEFCVRGEEFVMFMRRNH